MIAILRLLLALAMVATARAQWADGIYADFQTSMGNFTASLNYQQSPKAVANFIGLAEGSRAWIDPSSGAVQLDKPFYNGITFHRVVAGFMNQSGSKNGLGTDGPGYVFQDEISNGLGHASPYTLSMANSGYNSNGSQFFITVAPTTWLDGVHTVFGSIVSGQSVVDAINAVPTGTNNKPLTDVVILSVAIRRVGAAAQAFDIHHQNLPLCSGIAGKLSVESGVESKYTFTSSLPAGGIFHGHRSEDLGVWTRMGEVYRSPDEAEILEVVLDGASSPKAFYNLSQVAYPSAAGMASNANRTLVVSWPTNQTMTYVFNASGSGGTGTYFNGSATASFTFSVFSYTSDPYAAEWIFNTSAYGGIRVLSAMDGLSPTHVTGRQKLYQWTGVSWNQLSTGTLSLSR